MPHKIKAANCSDLPWKNKPNQQDVYTIRKILLINGNLYILLKEIKNEMITTGKEKHEQCFHYSRFYYNDDRNYTLDYEKVMRWYLDQK